MIYPKKMRWKDLTKIAVSGSRKFRETDLVTMFLDQYIREMFDTTEDVVIITGGAVGVDAAVELYCLRRGIKNMIIHARWTEIEHNVNGKNPAGVIRNQYMIDMANEFYAFWDGSSPGTMDAIQRAKKKGIVQEIFSVQSLRKRLKVKPPVKVAVPEYVSKKTLGLKGKERISDLILEAGIELPKITKGMIKQSKRIAEVSYKSRTPDIEYMKKPKVVKGVMFKKRYEI